MQCLFLLKMTVGYYSKQQNNSSDSDKYKSYNLSHTSIYKGFTFVSAGIVFSIRSGFIVNECVRTTSELNTSPWGAYLLCKTPISKPATPPET